MSKQTKFSGRPCPPEFKKALEGLRTRKLLDNAKLRTAVLKAAEETRAEQKAAK